MSKYEWEHGELKIPGSQWSALCKQLVEAWNQIIAERRALAMELYVHLKQTAHGKRDVNFRLEAESWAQRKRFADGNLVSELLNIVLVAPPATPGAPGNATRSAPRLRAPKKKDLPLAGARTRKFGSQKALYWEGQLELVDSTRTLHWHVSENNHAVDNAWEHPMGRALGRALNRVEWTRGSGGKFIGNDEYNTDSRDEDGGSNYVTRRFGPLGTSH